MNDIVVEANEKIKKIHMIECMLFVLNNGINRHRRSEDPVIRATLLMDKLCNFIDIGLSFLITDNPTLPEDTKEKMKKTAEEIENELNFVLDWIKSPMYSPDHCYGKFVMKESEKDFEIKAQKHNHVDYANSLCKSHDEKDKVD